MISEAIRDSLPLSSPAFYTSANLCCASGWLANSSLASVPHCLTCPVVIIIPGSRPSQIHQVPPLDAGLQVSDSARWQEVRDGRRGDIGGCERSPRRCPAEAQLLVLNIIGFRLWRIEFYFTCVKNYSKHEEQQHQKSSLPVSYWIFLSSCFLLLSFHQQNPL